LAMNNVFNFKGRKEERKKVKKFEQLGWILEGNVQDESQLWSIKGLKSLNRKRPFSMSLKVYSFPSKITATELLWAL